MPKALPIVVSSEKTKERTDRVAQGAKKLLDLHRSREAGRVEQERTSLQRQIDGTEAQIVSLVYQLYGLTDAEIKLVEATFT